MTLLVVASVVWIVTAAMLLLFAIERVQGRRYGLSLRVVLDAAVVHTKMSWSEQVPAINRNFFRQFFHYCIHVVLSWFLQLLQWTERSIRMVLRLNRKKAIVSAAVNPDSHLQKVAAHKEESALTPTEKKARKEAALRGDL